MICQNCDNLTITMVLFKYIVLSNLLIYWFSLEFFLFAVHISPVQLVLDLQGVVWSCKGKSPIVPFHGITSPYSYFEEIWIFAPIQRRLLSFLWSSFALDQAKIQICSMDPAECCQVRIFNFIMYIIKLKTRTWHHFAGSRLIPWNLVNLSHLYKILYLRRVPFMLFEYIKYSLFPLKSNSS